MGESITLTCDMDSTLTSYWGYYKWYRDKMEIRKDKIYTIISATAMHSGDYTCTYKASSTSYKSDPFTLEVSNDVFSDPEINKDPHQLTLGAPMTLTCATRLAPSRSGTELQFAFYRNGQKIQEFGKSNQYRVKSIKLYHSGDHTCEVGTATDNVRKTSQKLNIKIEAVALSAALNLLKMCLLPRAPISTGPLRPGAPMTLTCATRLAPYKLGTELQVAFYRNGEKVQEFGKSNQYRVKSSKLYHSGDYTCEVRTATDSVRKISQKLNIKIEGTMARPVISLTPNWGKIFTGESVTLTCNVGFSEQDKQKYYWYKDKQKISKSEKTFKIQSAITDDSGFYQCQTRSSGFSDPITLDVRNNDFILQAPNSVYEGDYLKLECNKKTKYSDFSPRFYHRDKLLQSDSGSNFHLDNAETSDSGTYRCTYNYYYGDYYEDSANVTVQELFSIPHISVSPNPLTLGADTTLTCDTSLALLRADTELEFAFYRNGKMVQGFRTSNTYRIKILDWDLLGNYTCDAITSTRSVKKTSRRSNIKIAVMFLK
ncbi:Fc receptor 5 [Pelobates cultripes]|uniref:Fc receptor 5 n=1 Tax=Pelobates cultripes TaxID=61616 RepID=A0AAD1TM82_PELCU|nr:Fc receptor 5 [Pelobates cultripes]